MANEGALPWRGALVIGLLAVVAGMVYAMVLAPWARGVAAWWLPPDAWTSLRAADAVARGDPLHLYASGPLFVATPGIALLLAPVSALGRALHLSLPPAPHPGTWWLLGPAGMSLGILLLYSIGDLGRALGVPGSLTGVQLAAATCCLWPAGIQYGHFEDVVALALAVSAMAALLRGRPVRAGLLLGLAIGMKQWALLGLPVLVALAPQGRRARSALTSVAVPAALVMPELVVDWVHARPGLLAARAFPQAGHAALWISERHGAIVGTPFRLGALLLSVAVAWRAFGRIQPEVLLAGLAVSFLGRMLFEPVVYSYYLCPALAFALMHERVRTGRVRRTAILGVGLLAYFTWRPETLVWWAGAVIISALVFAPAVKDAVGSGARRSAVSPTP